MPDYKKIKIGLVGAGKMGSLHAQKLATLSSVSFKGLFDAAPDAARLLASQYKRKAFLSLEALLEKCDAVVLAAATRAHLEIGKKCLAAGKHLLIEKPLAETSQDALLLVEMAEEKNLVLAVGHIERFNPAYKTLKNLVQKHIILRIDAKRFSPFPERMSGYDVVFDMMIHDIDLVLDLSGGVPEKIEASGKKVKTDQLDAASAKLLMPNGTLATIEGSRLEDKKTREITVTLEEFNLTADLLAKKLYKKLLSAPSAAHPFPTTEEIPVEDEDQLTLELKDFVRAIRHGSSPTVTGEHGLEAIRIAEAIEQGGYQA